MHRANTPSPWDHTIEREVLPFPLGGVFGIARENAAAATLPDRTLDDARRLELTLDHIQRKLNDLAQQIEEDDTLSSPFPFPLRPADDTTTENDPGDDGWPSRAA